MAFQYPPVKSYFDAASSEAEVKFAFEKGLRYAGHTLMVPEKFSYFTLPHLHDRYVQLTDDVSCAPCAFKQFCLSVQQTSTLHVV